MNGGTYRGGLWSGKDGVTGSYKIVVNKDKSES